MFQLLRFRSGGSSWLFLLFLPLLLLVSRVVGYTQGRLSRVPG
jgi:hypothetical protein